MSTTEKVSWADVNEKIASMLQQPGLTSEDLLNLTLARRLNTCSDNALGGILAESRNRGFFRR